MGKQHIKLKILGKSYDFTIDPDKEPDKEETYRVATRELNDYLVKLQQNRYNKEWTPTEYMSLAALKFAIDCVALRRQREVGSADLQQLEALDSEIDAYLNTL